MSAQDEKNLYVKIGGQQYGPISPNTLKLWIEERRFGPDDELRKIDQNVWVKARNVTHLSLLFQQSSKKQSEQALYKWVEGVQSGALMSLTHEGQQAARESIQQAEAELQRQREEVELLAKQAEMTKEEAAELEERRHLLEEEARKLQVNSEELMRMEGMVRRRKRRQTILTVSIIAVVAAVGTWLAIRLTEAQRDLETRIEAIDLRLEAIDQRLISLDEEIERARSLGDVELVATLEEERVELVEERAELEAARAEVEDTRRAEQPDIGDETAEVHGRTGRIAVAGEIQISGAGAGHHDRSRTTVAAHVNSALATPRSAYNELLKSDPNASGSITLIFSINPDGSVTGVTGSNNQLPAGELFGSMIRSLQGLRFQPIDDGPVQVSYPVTLTPN